MPSNQIPYGDAGMASFESESWTSTVLVTGNHPPLEIFDGVAPANAAVAQYSVVGFDSNGKVVLATIDTDTPANSIQAVGVTTTPLLEVADDQACPLYRSGCFNPDALVWDSSFDTDAKKLAAFEGAPSPTRIVLKSPLYKEA